MKGFFLAMYFAFTFRLNVAVRTKLDFAANETQEGEEDRPHKGSRGSMGESSPSSSIEANAPKWFKEMVHRRRMSWYKAISKSCSEEATKCEEFVKETLGSMDCSSEEDVDKCMNGVLAPVKKYGEKCCEAGTEYDDFLVDKVPETEKFTFDAETAVFVLDMQRDFTTGSFAQPCWATGGESLMKGIIDFMAEASEAGATIIASKNFHPDDHCSFKGESDCQNTKGGENATTFHNEFPAHTSWHSFAKLPQKKGSRHSRHGDTHLYAKPNAAPDTPYCKHLAKTVFTDGFPLDHLCRDSAYIGTDFERAMAYALKKLPAGQVEVVYKGFHKDYESFSATPHVIGVKDDCEDCRTFTGGYALSKGRSKKCHGKWHALSCHPTDQELHDPEKKMRSVLSILNAKNIKKLYVVGFVWDKGVEETARFAKEAAAWCKGTKDLRGDSFLCDKGPWWKASKDAAVTVVANLVRPSFDGKPGAPFVASMCDGGAADGNFCTQGGGTLPAHEAVFQDLKEGGVEVVRQKQHHTKCF